MRRFSKTALITLCLVILAVSVTAQTADSAASSRLVDVGGYQLYIDCQGTGTPTVILEAGLGGSSEDWDSVMPGAAALTRVCRYDRPHEGKSGPAPRALRQLGGHDYLALRTGEEIINDLHTLLERAGVAGPYVLVGHSLGGLYVMLYAKRYPEQVVGMVLVDASHPDQIARAAALTTPERTKRSRDGLMQNEEGADIDEILALVRAAHWHTTIPLYVLAAGRDRPPPEGWSAVNWAQYRQAQREMQQDHARRSTHGTLVIAEKSGHDIPEDQPELVVDAIKQVVTAARRKD